MRNKRKFHFSEYFQSLLLLGVLLVLVVLLSIYSDAFMTGKNWMNILKNHMAHQLILAVGMTFVISTAGIDLSVGSILALSGIILAFALNAGMAIPLAVALALFSAAAMGAVNGLLVANFRINPLIITLGSASVFRGLAIIVTGGTPIYGMPQEFLQLAKGDYWLPIPVLMAAVVLGAALVLSHCTKWGRYTLALGSNCEALRRLGVNVAWQKVSVYALSGFLAGVATLIISARLNTAEATAGSGMEMNAIAAVIMGGTLLSGGKSTLFGTTVACLLLSVIKNGLTMLSVDAQYQEFIIGMLLLLAVVVTDLRQKRLKRSGGDAAPGAAIPKSCSCDAGSDKKTV
ncbi:MAG: ABC transporter permease [Firmicutes bacterium]|nr:ABC transporter permease [Bacillota bacterium]